MGQGDEPGPLRRPLTSSRRHPLTPARRSEAPATEAETTEAETTAAAEEAAEPEAEAPAAAEGTYSCQLESHCREYVGVPYTMTDGDETREITVEMVQGECTQRQGTWTEGPCSDEGIAATCTEEHMVWHYPADADLADQQDLCDNVRNGAWATM